MIETRQIPSRFSQECEAGRFDTAAAILMRHVNDHTPSEEDAEEWKSRIEELNEACRLDNRQAIWTWFKALYPRAMGLIPVANKYKFTAGIERLLKKRNWINVNQEESDAK